MGDETGIAKRFWVKFKDESLLAIYTPFVLCLASGDLNSESFRHCISQDVHFLKAFVRAYELAEDYADDDDDRALIRELRRIVLNDLKNRDTVAREWGFELLEDCSSDNATVKCTDFLLATATGKVEGLKFSVKSATPFEKTKLAAYTLGAMAPRMRLYAFICKEIQALQGSDKSSYIYRKWIAEYSSQKFLAYALQTEDMLDKLSIPLTGEELEVIEKLYHHSMKLEADFFCSQPVSQPTVAPLSRVHDRLEQSLTVFCDFDMTCTSVDSSALLAEIAIRTASKADLNRSETSHARLSSADLKSRLDLLSKQYTEEFEEYIKSILPSETAPHFDYKGLGKALEQLSDFEKRANSRVVELGVLKGLNLEDIKRVGQGLILQNGCRGFFEKIVKHKNLKAAVHVLTYCWCGDLIRSAFSSGGLDVMEIHSNELVYEQSISTGEITKKMESPMEKFQFFNNILNKRSSDAKHLTIYIGGSVGDFLCLLEADIGIVIDSSPSLRRLGDKFRVSFVPLFPGLVKKQRELSESGTTNWKGMSGVLYTVSGWAEIHAFILGTRSCS